MRICVMGTGYVGLVAGSCLSDAGNHVQCADVDQDKVDRLERGEIPIFEPGLEELILRNKKGGRLSFTTNLKEAIGSAQVIFVAVGTPQGQDGSSNLQYLYAAVETIKTSIQRDMVVVLKSTVPVGTAAEVKRRLTGISHKVEVVSNPEFLKEGTAVTDFLKPERVIIGTQSEEGKRVMSDLYAPYVRSGNPILFMSNVSAELSKYAANGFLAMKISYINDVALLAERVGADIHEVRQAIVSDSRIGNKFLYPGCGYGGSCFPKDVLALIHMGKEHGVPLNLFTSVHETNERQKKLMFEKMNRHFAGNLKGKTIALWGLSFKPQTDDMREAPSVTLIQSLLSAGANVNAYDPVAAHEAKRIFENRIRICSDSYDALEKADALAILTEWNEFRCPDFERMKKTLTTAVIFDGRNLFTPASIRSQGFKYYCIGTPDA